MTLAYDAMFFAREVHAGQQRRYTGDPYADHLAEVAGIVAAVASGEPGFEDVMIAVAWLHDCVEDQGVSSGALRDRFGGTVEKGVMLLSDLENGDRATRKALSRQRLAAAPSWVQTVKVADLISNTPSIVRHDPDFARVYLEEKRLLLDVLTLADERLVAIARNQISEAA